jgi:hypothetical protein
MTGMPTPPSSRSIKIDQDERGGWSSDRPRRDGAPPRPADVAVRGRALRPAALLRYSPGSLLMIVSGSSEAREELAGRAVEEKAALLSLAKVRSLLAARGIDDDDKARQLLEAAVAKRLTGGDSVALVAEGIDAAERERYVRMAAAHRRPCHLILVEAAPDQLAEEDREPVNALRRALDAGQLGAGGFHTFLRLGGASLTEVKRIVFRAPQADD